MASPSATRRPRPSAPSCDGARSIRSAAISRASASSAAWASPSIPRPGSGAGRSSVAAAAQPWQPGGRRCPFVDTWWQTETGHILITPLPGVTTLKPGSATKPFPGIEAQVFNDKGEPAKAGYLVIKKPWPGMLRGIYRDPKRFQAQYWSRYPGIYFTGDGAKMDEDGHFWLLGRVDDVMNVSGHRVSTMEVESALVD